MKLVGLYDSPFVRRVAISAHVLGLTYEHQTLSVFRSMDAFRAFNPLLRAPTLVTDDGRTLTESSFILDYLDECSAGRRLLPAGGEKRWRALEVIACALVCADKAVAIVYEEKQRPAEFHFAPMIERAYGQVRTALGMLESGDWPLAPDVAELDQVTITTAVAFRFVAYVNAELALAVQYPRLAALSAHCETLAPFLATRYT
jgi:glutathione S-transferase